MNGWVKLHRKLMNNQALLSNPSALKMLVVLLLNVDKDGKWRGGRFQLSHLCRLKPSNTYKTQKWLEMHKIVTLSSNTKKYTEITVVNWAKYQGNGNTKQYQQSNNTVTALGHSYKNKNIRIKNRVKKPSIGKSGKEILKTRNPSVYKKLYGTKK